MVSGRMIHFLLFGVLIVGGCFYVFIFLPQSATPKVRYGCEKLEAVCNDDDVAKNCGVRTIHVIIYGEKIRSNCKCLMHIILV